MKAQWLIPIVALACASRTHVSPKVATPVATKSMLRVSLPNTEHPLAHTWTIRAFPHVALSVAMPEDGTELDAKDLGQVQALLAVGVQARERRPTYVLLAYPISKAPQAASVEQRLALLPYLLHDLGPEASRNPVDLDGLHGVEFVSKTDGVYQRARVFATPHTVVALLVRSPDLAQTLDPDARVFFESLEWYDDQR